MSKETEKYCIGMERCHYYKQLQQEIQGHGSPDCVWATWHNIPKKSNNRDVILCKHPYKIETIKEKSGIIIQSSGWG